MYINQHCRSIVSRGQLRANVFCCILFLSALIFYASPARAADLMGGPAFSDPSVTMPMPDEWQAQPVEYEEWADGAALAVLLDQHLYGVYLDLVKEFARARGVDIAVREGTCGISAGLLSGRKVDLAGFCCPPATSDRLPGLVYHTVGVGPLALIVHPNNPVDDITLGMAREVFAGRRTRWAQVPGAEAMGSALIQPVARLHCKQRPGHWRLLLDNEDQFGTNLAEVGSIDDMMLSVSEDPLAIGHVATWNVTRLGGRWPVKVLRIGGVAPDDRQALLEGRYPLYRAYTVAVWEDPRVHKRLATELVAFLRESAGRLDPTFHMITVRELRDAGWIFTGDELTGGPASAR